MVTLTQLIKNSSIHRKKKIKKTKRAKALEKNPQKKGVCQRIMKFNPRKPNSANRSVARVILTNKRKIYVFIPGEGDHRLLNYANILVRGGRTKDLPGFKYKAIRGKYDLKTPIRKTRRSKYGIKKK